jgi:hypothetical protein
MTYPLNSENRYDSQIASQIGNSGRFMAGDILFIILRVNDSILIAHLSAAIMFISSIKQRILHNFSPAARSTQ